jgi:hypothetical protein
MPDRHLRFTLPDPVAATEAQEHADGVWMSHVDAKTAVLMQVPDIGAFVRVLLPVSTADGSTLTYGAWISVYPDRLQEAAEIWDTPAYLSLVLDGVLANAIPPWGLLAAPVHAVVRSRRHTPYCVSSSDETLAQVLAGSLTSD